MRLASLLAASLLVALPPAALADPSPATPAATPSPTLAARPGSVAPTTPATIPKPAAKLVLPTDKPPPPPPVPQLVVDYYPPAARAAGVEGVANLTCDRDEHLGLRDCKLDSEKPAGEGFGAAALAMAAKSPDNPKINLPDPKDRPPFTFTLVFALHPPAIAPDPTQMGHLVTQPSLVAGPSFKQVHDAYPVRALDDQIDGVALIDCLVGKTGKLSACAVAGENPSGYGFGSAALDLASDFSLKPRLVDGDPVDGAEVRVPIHFQNQDPSAPLELKTVPAQ